MKMRRLTFKRHKFPVWDTFDGISMFTDKSGKKRKILLPIRNIAYGMIEEGREFIIDMASGNIYHRRAVFDLHIHGSFGLYRYFLSGGDTILATHINIHTITQFLHSVVCKLSGEPYPSRDYARIDPSCRQTSQEFIVGPNKTLCIFSGVVVSYYKGMTVDVLHIVKYPTPVVGILDGHYLYILGDPKSHLYDLTELVVRNLELLTALSSDIQTHILSFLTI